MGKLCGQISLNKVIDILIFYLSSITVTFTHYSNKLPIERVEYADENQQCY